MPKINQKYGVPRLHGSAGFAPRRSKFLDGTITTYYGRGQRPDAGETYADPGDWPGAGTLLRVPQVVWLSGLVPSPNLPTVSINYGASGVSGGVVVQGVLSVANRDQASYLAWMAMMADAKARVEALRPGRTWVHVVDWFAWGGGSDSSTDPFVPFPGIGTGGLSSPRYVGNDEGYLHLRCPAAATPDPFFGTDFLHLYVGHWAKDASGLRSFFTHSVTPATATAAFLSDRANAVANADGFRRYAVHCYGYTQTWEHFPPAVNGDHFANPVGSGTFNDYLAGINSDHDTNPTDSNAVISATCDAMASALDGSTADITYEGLIDGLTADDLVAALADHFGFDPDTGKDVGNTP